MIKAFLIDQDEWDLFLGCIAGAYRSSPNESTKLAPNLMCFGREVRLPADLVYGVREDDSIPSYRSHVEAIQEHMFRAHEVARAYLKVSAKRSKDLYDTKLAFVTYKPGDLVWMLHETRKIGVTPKLEKKYDGPFVVTEKTSPVNFVVQTDRDGRTVLIHHDKLKHYNGSNVPRWASKVVKKIVNKC
ncbi:uncharacterized protein LOC123562304 [Mercenaria mercenaria]|uniref:uncharacterized protein LOC123562304 n=1 Tax=Mercenaria mercenaria TaxID=6596 RepID=UPI00234F90D0|nr:uncharacterized protein LOC123562304 [Mercenaria mercenaria]